MLVYQRVPPSKKCPEDVALSWPPRKTLFFLKNVYCRESKKVRDWIKLNQFNVKSTYIVAVRHLLGKNSCQAQGTNVKNCFTITPALDNTEVFLLEIGYSTRLTSNHPDKKQHFESPGALTKTNVAPENHYING